MKEWVGGEYSLIRRGSMNRAGGVGDGNAKKRYGDAGMRKRIRFNPNATISGHTACVVMAQSRRDKAAYDYNKRNIIVYKSGLSKGN